MFAIDCFCQDLKFVMPLKGIPGKDFFIDYYVDHDTSLDLQDAFCGKYTYDGHKGTDFILRSFKTMDSGVIVNAVADGCVFETQDGLYDRNKHWITGALGNHVCIIHKNGICTYYGHLMKHSLLVKKGDSIKAGQPIGKVGSSGFSTTAHLHLEVRDNQNNTIDPFSGNCSLIDASYWISQPQPDSALYAVDDGFVPYTPNIDTLKERFLVTDTFLINRDTTVTYWISIHGIRKGDKTHVEWFTPEGTLWFRYNYTWTNNWVHDYTWFTMNMPKQKGKWLAKYFVNSKLITSRNFYVLKHTTL